MRTSESDPPLEIHSVEASPAGKEQIVLRVRVKGRWRRRATPGRALLVVEAEGRPHRFPAAPETKRAAFGRPGAWYASFALPAWLAPRLAENAMLWVDSAAIPLPTPRGELPDVPAPTHEPEIVPDPAERVRNPAEDELAAPAAGRRPEPRPFAPIELADRVRREVEPPSPDDSEDVAVSGAGSNGHQSGGPLAGLRAELQQRAAAEARLRGELAQLRSELEARSASHGRIDHTHEQLRIELRELRDLVSSLSGLAAERDALAKRVETLESALAAITVSRDTARREAEELRRQLEQLAMHPPTDQAGHLPSSAIEEAEALLAEARSLRTRIRRPSTKPALDGADRA
jgi:hypothetical protein